MGTRENERKKVNKIAITVLVVLLLLCLLGGLGYLVFQWYSGHIAEESYGNLLGFVDEAVSAGEQDEIDNRPENPIDFASLKAKNDDVYAWIKIPNTKINYPVVQSKVDDNFYLNRSIDKKYLTYSSINLLQEVMLMKNRIRDLREDNDLSQRKVAEAIGITQRKYSYVETGTQQLTDELLCRLADFYGVSVDYLLCRTDRDKPYPKK